MGAETTRTFETRLKVDLPTDELLQCCAGLFTHIKHRLFADIASGKNIGELKNIYLASYEITARHFNALRVQVEGKIASIKKRQPALIIEIKERIFSLTKKIKKLTKSQAKPQLIHQKKRRLNILENKLQKLKKDHAKGTIRCCFGSKKLFRAQFDLEANKYPSHQEWLKKWKKARTSELFFLGSKDETSGNQTCTATLQADQTLQLRIRLPDAIANRENTLSFLRSILNTANRRSSPFYKMSKPKPLAGACCTMTKDGVFLQPLTFKKLPVPLIKIPES